MVRIKWRKKAVFSYLRLGHACGTCTLHLCQSLRYTLLCIFLCFQSLRFSLFSPSDVSRLVRLSCLRLSLCRTQLNLEHLSLLFFFGQLCL